MAKFSTFSKAVCNVQFFDGDDAVNLTLVIGDKTDKRLADTASALEKADNAKTIADKVARCKAAVAGLIGEDNLKRILAKCEEPDSFDIQRIYFFILGEYKAAKTKNLLGSPVR